ncbi:beta-ketoacyl synthase N-terminal-like domain-containing protein [Paenibacillus sp. sgz5001063]|uniref:type I polyketide synthase n=1 Tax=Paenibacillus sp. sgz5001063 TaxID=3242474 RepID=UPI0036D420F1
MEPKTMKLPAFNRNLLKDIPILEEKDSGEIAVIGMSLRMPGADNPEQFWQMLRSGVDSTGPFPEQRQELGDRYLRLTKRQEGPYRYMDGGYLDSIAEFDPRFFKLSEIEARMMSPEQRIFLECAYEAIEDSGCSRKKLRGSRTGVYVGHVGYMGETKYLQMVSETADTLAKPLGVPGNLDSISASRISYLLDLHGPAMLIDTACSSSLVAVHLAVNAIRSGDCEMALAGGIRLNLTPLDVKEAKVGMESSDGITRTFDGQADGAASSEGVACVLLKPLRAAMQDKDPIYAVIKGSAVNQDGSSIGITAPNGKAQTDVVLRAWDSAGIDPRSLSLIEAHGTGTRLGDPIEVDGLQKAFEKFTDHKQFCAIGSLKSNLGHCYQTAGIAGLIKTCLALQHQEIPPTLHFKRPHPHIPFIRTALYVNNRLRRWPEGDTPRRAAISAFGFSGTNCHVVLEEAPRQAASNPALRWRKEIFTLSAAHPASLRGMALRYEAFLAEHANESLTDICWTVNTGRDHHACRLAIVCSSVADLRSQLAAYAKEPEAWTLLSDGSAESALAEMYLQGGEPNWDELYPVGSVNRLHLPAYFFNRQSYWVELPSEELLPMPTTKTKVLTPEARENTPEPVAVTVDGKDIENVLLNIYRTGMGKPDIGLNDNFFEAGGNSILLNTIYARLQQAFPGKLKMTDLFVYTTISRLARFLAGSSESLSQAGPEADAKPVLKRDELMQYAEAATAPSPFRKPRESVARSLARGKQILAQSGKVLQAQGDHSGHLPKASDETETLEDLVAGFANGTLVIEDAIKQLRR